MKQSTLMSIQNWESIPGTYWRRGSGVCMVTYLVRCGGRADCVGGADRVIFCAAGMREEHFVVDGLLAC